MSKIIRKPRKKSADALDLNDRAVLHYALLARTKDGLFCEKPIKTAIELNSSAATIVRTFHSLVQKGACKVVEKNRTSAKGVPLPTIYRPIPPVEWAYLALITPIPPVERAPISIESNPVPPVERGNPIPNGTLEALQRTESLISTNCVVGQQHSSSAGRVGKPKVMRVGGRLILDEENL